MKGSLEMKGNPTEKKVINLNILQIYYCFAYSLSFLKIVKNLKVLHVLHILQQGSPLISKLEFFFIKADFRGLSAHFIHINYF